MDRSSATDDPAGLTHRGIRLFGHYYPTHAVFHTPAGVHFHLGARRHRKGKHPLRSAVLLFFASFFTLLGALCFFIAAYLLLPELSEN